MTRPATPTLNTSGFFNTAIIACAINRLQGGEPSVGYGFSVAMSRIHLILGWALLSATVGLALRIIEDRSERVGQFVTGLLGMAWTVMSYLVVPILVVEQKGPFAALKESSVLLKKTWGERLVGNSSFGLIFFLLLALYVYWLGFESGNRWWPIPFGILTGIAVLTKGPIGVGLPCLVVASHLLWTRRIGGAVRRRVYSRGSSHVFSIDLSPRTRPTPQGLQRRRSRSIPSPWPRRRRPRPRARRHPSGRS